MDGVKVVEKPSNPAYYPEYYLVDSLPLAERIKRYGEYWDKKSKELMRRDRLELEEWFNNNAIGTDLVFDLHDTTMHPAVWEMEKNSSWTSRHGVYKTKDGYTAFPSSQEHILVGYYSFTPGFDDIMASFRPRGVRTSYEVHKHDWEMLEHELGKEKLLGEAEIGIEYFPVLFDKNPKTESRITFSQGVKFFLTLLGHIRNPSL